MTDRFTGKRIFLTGAAQGIGLATARACLAENASVFMLDMDGELLGETALAAVFLISDECPFINAACLTADGGLSVQHHPS